MESEREVDVGYVTVEQAAQFLGVNRSAIYQAIDAGSLKTYRVLSRTALRRADLEAYRQREGRNRIRAKAKKEIAA